ncbi:hypothetical protein F5Y09DRAFT_306881 [Xylaria sp. FL1042]|nr:hypothetical protein F5Y09DRAFT_306881 [Xylaria sp. FL1042]
MRLIDVRTGDLVEVQWDSTPPDYTILSHRWCDDEVTFQDMQNPDGNVQNKKGFAKIKFACEETIRDGMSYTWVDTCCIDKSSSAELAEAINSMYNWYRLSRVCYAYMADVSWADGDAFPWLAFRASEWFTRCWTLQELIAPRLVKFYSKEWRLLGVKFGLHVSHAYDVYFRRKDWDIQFHQVLSQITGIPATVFDAREVNLGEFSVAQRMSWASARNCTKVEDRAYSLLGIFNVNMPLLYGEGKKAFSRLQEEIIKQLDDHSIFAWTVTEDDSRFLEPSDILAESPMDFARSSTMVPYNVEVGRLSAMTKRGLYMHLFVQPVTLPETTHIRWLGTMCDAYYALLNCGDTADPYMRSSRESHYKRLALVIIRANDPSAPPSASESRQYIRLCTKTHILLEEQEKFENISLFQDFYLSRRVPHSLVTSLRVKTNLHLRVLPIMYQEAAMWPPISLAGVLFYEQNILVSGHNNLMQVGSGQNIEVAGKNNIAQFDNVHDIKLAGEENFVRFSFGHDVFVMGVNNSVVDYDGLPHILDYSHDVAAENSNHAYIYFGDGTFASWSLNHISLPGPQQEVVKVDLNNNLTEDRIVLLLAVIKDPGIMLCHLCEESVAEDRVKAIKSRAYESAEISFVDLIEGGIASSSMVVAKKWRISATLNGELPHLPFPEPVPKHWRSIVITLEVRKLGDDIGDNNSSFYKSQDSIAKEMEI